jgi:hypothetical protein
VSIAFAADRSPQSAACGYSPSIQDCCRARRVCCLGIQCGLGDGIRPEGAEARPRRASGGRTADERRPNLSIDHTDTAQVSALTSICVRKDQRAECSLLSAEPENSLLRVRPLTGQRSHMPWPCGPLRGFTVYGTVLQKYTFISTHY